MLKETENGFIDLREKWRVYCKTIRPLGEGTSPFEYRFYLKVLRAANLEDAVSHNGEERALERARKRFTGLDGFFQKKRLPQELIDTLISWRPRLSIATMKTGSVVDFQSHLNTLLTDDLALTLEKMNAAMEHYRQDRPDLQQWALRFYEGAMSKIEDFPNFPLVIRENFILTVEPWDIGKDVDDPKLELQEFTSFRERRSFLAENEFDRGLRIGTHDDHLAYREFYKAEVLKKKTNYFNGYGYRLVEFMATANRHTLSFERSRYRSFINTCESRALEAAYFHKHTDKSAPEMRNASVCRHRSRNPDIFNLKDRNAFVGINTITILVGQAKNDHPRFIKHMRGREMDEGIDTDHVVPAGSFQPAISRDIEEDEALLSPHWREHFTIRDNVIREFLEECRDMDGEIDEATDRGQDWRYRGGAAQSYRVMREALTAGVQARLFYLGLGYDPLTEKPELLSALVMDKRLAQLLGLTNDSAFNDEGEGYPENFFTETNLTKLTSSNGRWLSPGMACLLLARKHYKFLVSCLEPTKGSVLPSGVNGRKRRK